MIIKFFIYILIFSGLRSEIDYLTEIQPIFDNNVFKKKYITIEKPKLIVKESKIKQILSFINIFKFIKIIY